MSLPAHASSESSWTRRTGDQRGAKVSRPARPTESPATIAAAAVLEAEVAAKAVAEAQAAVVRAGCAVAELAAVAARAAAATAPGRGDQSQRFPGTGGQVAEPGDDATAGRALHDQLTGLPRRRLLVDRLSLALARAKRSQRSVAVLLVGLDRFPALLDSYGPSVGDRLVLSTAERLRGQLRETDTSARVGADEFVIVCEDLNEPSDSSVIADRLATALAADVQVGERAVTVHASIGLAVSGAGSTPQDLLEQAGVARARVELEGQAWRLTRVHGQRWAIENRTGADAVSVRLTGLGSLLVFGVRDWSNTVDRWPDGVSVEVVAQTAWRRNDPPGLRVVWTTEDTPDYERVLTMPWPR